MGKIIMIQSSWPLPDWKLNWRTQVHFKLFQQLTWISLVIWFFYSIILVLLMNMLSTVGSKTSKNVISGLLNDLLLSRCYSATRVDAIALVFRWRASSASTSWPRVHCPPPVSTSGWWCGSNSAKGLSCLTRS